MKISITAISTFVVVLTSLASSSVFAGAYKNKYPNDVVPLSKSSEYFKNNPAPDYWLLSPYQTAQKTGSSCSVATALVVLNGARSLTDMSEDEPLINHNSLLKRVQIEEWSEAVKSGGPGISLANFKKYLKKSFDDFGMSNYEVQMDHVTKVNGTSLSVFREILARNERSQDDFIIINFDQGYVMESETVGHFAPVSAYDAKTDRVLLLDPDREWYEPYWVPVEKLLNAMMENVEKSKKPRGFLYISKKN